MSDRLKCLEKKILSYTTAATLVIGLLGLTACDYQDDDITATRQAEYDQQLTQESLPRNLAETTYKITLNDQYGDPAFHASGIKIGNAVINGREMSLFVTAGHVLNSMQSIPDGSIELYRPQYGEKEGGERIPSASMLVAQARLRDTALIALPLTPNMQSSSFPPLPDSVALPQEGDVWSLNYGDSDTSYNITRFGSIKNTSTEVQYSNCTPLTAITWESTDTPTTPGSSGAPVVDKYGRLIAIINCGDKKYHMTVMTPITRRTIDELTAQLAQFKTN